MLFFSYTCAPYGHTKCIFGRLLSFISFLNFILLNITFLGNRAIIPVSYTCILCLFSSFIKGGYWALVVEVYNISTAASKKEVGHLIGSRVWGVQLQHYIWPRRILDGQVQAHSLQTLMLQKGVELGHVLLLNTNRKPHIGNPVALLHLTVTLKGQTN